MKPLAKSRTWWTGWIGAGGSATWLGLDTAYEKAWEIYGDNADMLAWLWGKIEAVRGLKWWLAVAMLGAFFAMLYFRYDDKRKAAR